MSFKIAIPHSTGIKPRYVSVSTQSASIAVNGGVPVVLNCTSSCSGTVPAAVGSDVFTVALYDAPSGAGNVLSQGSTTFVVVQNAANTVNVSFNGIVRSVTLATSGLRITRGITSTTPLTIAAKDADNNIILGTYNSPITLTNSDPTGSTSLSVTTLASSAPVVSVAYNGANSYAGSSIAATFSGIVGTSTVMLANPCGLVGTLTGPGYYPCDLQFAYNIPTRVQGIGQTIAVVDAYDDPSAEADLGVYRTTFGLPNCTTANGCFRKLAQDGSTAYPGTDPAPNPGWSGETSLDLDMVSAVCPNCHIVLIEATSPTISNLGTSVNTAVIAGANIVSNSYGGPEYSSELNDDTLYFRHPGVVLTVSAGDNDYVAGTQYPASSPYVTAVGGTRLSSAANARGWSESVWNNAGSGTGSGCSAYEPKPTWQTDVGCARRVVSDVSAVADPNAGLYVYDSYSAGGWIIVGGTSASAPLIGAVYALAGNASTVNAGSYPYLHPSGLNDVTTGNNGVCGVTYLCTAGPGYDGPTGLGTPNGTGGLGSFTRTAGSSNDRTLTGSTRNLSQPGPSRRACAAPTPGHFACDALVRTDVGTIRR